MNNSIRYSYFENKFDIVYRNEVPTRVMPPHTHNAIEIYLSLSPMPNILLGHNVMPLKAPSLLIIPSYCIHQFTQHESLKYERYIITISTSWFEAIMPETTKYGYFTETNCPAAIALNENQLTCLTRGANAFIECDDVLSKMSIFFDILKTVDDIFQNVRLEEIGNFEQIASGTRKTVKEIIEYIDLHLFENIRLADLAKNFYLSPNHISRIFKQYTNIQISQYITLQRMTKAKQMLRSGCTVSETQNNTGYASYEHFFRTFKKTVGCTPREYRDAHYHPAP